MNIWCDDYSSFFNYVLQNIEINDALWSVWLNDQLFICTSYDHFILSSFLFLKTERVFWNTLCVKQQINDIDCQSEKMNTKR